MIILLAWEYLLPFYKHSCQKIDLTFTGYIALTYRIMALTFASAGYCIINRSSCSAFPLLFRLVEFAWSCETLAA